jgi:hypothetical protein
VFIHSVIVVIRCAFFFNLTLALSISRFLALRLRFAGAFFLAVPVSFALA